MNISWVNIGRHFQRLTLLRVLLAIVLGVVIADCVTIPLWGVAVGFFIAVMAAWLLRRRNVADLYVMTAATLAAMMTLYGGDSLRAEGGSPHPDLHSFHRSISSHSNLSPRFILRLRQVAERRIESLGLSPDVEALAKGVTIGQRSDITPSLRLCYTRSGVAHLLAVSGLHVGFIFLLTNMLLAWLSLFRRGVVVRCVVTLIVMWIYASVAGSSASVVRATLMFSLFQVASTMSRGGPALNRLAGAASVMLLWNGRWLYDVGFMLSFLAVVAIVEWCEPLSQLAIRHKSTMQLLDEMSRRRRLMRTVRGWMEGVAKRLCWQTWLAFVVGVVASVATMPFVSHTFGIVTLWSIITGPLMILLCSILIGATMLYIVEGGLFGDIFGGRLTALVAEWTGGAMNAIAAWCSQHDALIFDIRLGTLLTVIIYLVLLLLTILRWSKIK